jgi:hypothetical protein
MMSKRLPDGAPSTLAVVAGAESLAVGERYCYFGAGPSLFRVPREGGALDIVAMGYERIGTLADSGPWLYFADYYRGTIDRVAK